MKNLVYEKKEVAPSTGANKADGESAVLAACGDYYERYSVVERPRRFWKLDGVSKTDRVKFYFKLVRTAANASSLKPLYRMDATA
jgi:hypothetical protein